MQEVTCPECEADIEKELADIIRKNSKRMGQETIDFNCPSCEETITLTFYDMWDGAN